jgi:hypothetical protein
MTHAESALGRTIFIGVKEICVNCLMEIISVDHADHDGERDRHAAERFYDDDLIMHHGEDEFNTKWIHTASDLVECRHPLIADLGMVLLP